MTLPEWLMVGTPAVLALILLVMIVGIPRRR